MLSPPALLPAQPDQLTAVASQWLGGSWDGPLIWRESVRSGPRQLSAAAAPRWTFPLTIKAIVLDLDGTMMPSYKTLSAIQHFEEQLQIPIGAPSFVDHHLAEFAFQSLLHRPALARQAAVEYVRKNRIVITAAILRRMRSLQEQSFCLYRGVRDLLVHAKRLGVFVGIYTSTSCENAVRRLNDCLTGPNLIDALWAKDDRTESLASFQEYAEVLIPCSYCKPDDTPLRQLASLSRVRPCEILYVGDSTCDLDVAYRERTNPGAIFCFQQQGATDICAKTLGINARLRPGHAVLGADAVNRRIICAYEMEAPVRSRSRQSDWWPRTWVGSGCVPWIEWHNDTASAVNTSP